MDTWKELASEMLVRNKDLEEYADKRLGALKKWEEYYLRVKTKNGRKYYSYSRKRVKSNSKLRGTTTEKANTKEKRRAQEKSKYLGKADNPTVLEIQEYNVCKQVKKISAHNVMCIEKALKDYIDINNEQIKKCLKPTYKNDGIIEKSLMKLNVSSEWKEKGLRKRDENNRYYPERLVHKTNDGEMVRTRGEVIFANILNALGVEYVYELPHEICNQIRIPDFTILHPTTGEEILIEYMGMYGDESYRMKNTIKICEYFQAGYVLGKNLFVFMDGEEGHFDSDTVYRVLRAITN